MVSKGLEVNLLRAALMKNSHTLSSFAKSRGYNPAAVRQVVYKHWPPARCVRKPHGKLTKQILADLRQYYQPNEDVHGRSR